MGNLRHQYTHEVKSGDTFSEIAQKFGISLEELQAANPHIQDIDLIYPGDNINIPSSSSSFSGDGGYQDVVTIQSGDTLSEIAQRYPGVSWQEIAQANPHIENPHDIDVGDQIKIPIDDESYGGAKTPGFDEDYQETNFSNDYNEIRVDVDGDGYKEHIVIDDDGDGIADTIVSDYDQDGIIDEIETFDA